MGDSTPFSFLVRRVLLTALRSSLTSPRPFRRCCALDQVCGGPDEGGQVGQLGVEAGAGGSRERAARGRSLPHTCRAHQRRLQTREGRDVEVRNAVKPFGGIHYRGCCHTYLSLYIALHSGAGSPLTRVE